MPTHPVSPSPSPTSPTPLSAKPWVQPSPSTPMPPARLVHRPQPGSQYRLLADQQPQRVDSRPRFRCRWQDGHAQRTAARVRPRPGPRPQHQPQRLHGPRPPTRRAPPAERSGTGLDEQLVAQLQPGNATTSMPIQVPPCPTAQPRPRCPSAQASAPCSSAACAAPTTAACRPCSTACKSPTAVRACCQSHLGRAG